jgi:hypothetical protein
MSMHTQAQILERRRRGKEDRVKFWRERRYGDLECLAARFRTHVYELHAHESSLSAGSSSETWSHAFTRAHRALEQRQVALEADAQMMECDEPHSDALRPDLCS